MELDDLRLTYDRRLVALAMVLQLAPTLWFLRTDFALYGGDWDRLLPRLVVRGVMVLVSVAGLVAMARVRTRHAYSLTVLLLACGLVLTTLGLNVLRPAGATLPLRTPLYVMVVLYFAMPNTLWRQILPPLLQSVTLIALRFTHLTGVAEGDQAGDVLVITVLNVFGVLAVTRRLNLEAHDVAAVAAERAARAESERALAELRTLRGIIPICAHCKKVRTEVGDWQQIEAYVRQHSEAEFSHGVCPECETRHYQ